MIRQNAAVRTLFMLNCEVMHMEAAVDELLDQNLSDRDRKFLTWKVQKDLERLERSLMNLEAYSDEHSVNNTQSNIDYLLEKVCTLTVFIQLWFA